MQHIGSEALDGFIREDVPYMDLTTMILGIGSEPGRISFTSREDAVICGTEEAAGIFQKYGIAVNKMKPSGASISAGEMFLEGEGSAESLHLAWKVSLNILEYCSGIATRTRRLVDLARSVNPEVGVVTTRKSFPGTKALVVKSILADGAYPHRLGLSETVLVFRQHMNFLGGMDKLVQMIPQLKNKACEKKILVEVESVEEAMLMGTSGVDGIQMDKLTPGDMKEVVDSLKKASPRLLFIATGGINESNVRDYAATGVQVLSTSSVYFGKPVDIGVKMVKTE